MEQTQIIKKTEERRETALEILRDKFLEYLLANQYAENTLKGAYYSLESFFKYLNEIKVYEITDVTSETIGDYQSWLRQIKTKKGQALQSSTIADKLYPLKLFFSYLVKNGHILLDPTRDMEIPSIKKRLPQTILTQDEVAAFLSLPRLDIITGYRDRTIFELLYSTGIRNAELRKITLKDIDFENRTINIREGKGGKDRITPLTRVAAGYLKEYSEKIRPRFQRNGKPDQKDTEVVFLNLNGRQFDRQGLCQLIQKYAKASNINKPVTAHIFRHSIATHLLENGMSIRYIQEFLGHESLGTTQQYAKVTIEDLKKMYNRFHPKEKRKRHFSTRNDDV